MLVAFLSLMGVKGIAQPLLVENFEYTIGTLLTANGWTAHNAGGTNPFSVSAMSISYPGYLGSGIGDEVTYSPSGEDVNRAFTSQNSGVVYAAFIINVTSSQTTGDYFAHFGATSGAAVTSFGGRVWIKKDATTTNFAFGISKSSTAANISYTGFDYLPGVTYLVVVKYNIVSGTTNDFANLFINPVPGNPEPTSPTISTLAIDDASSDPAQLTSFCLRQGSASNSAILRLDGIRVATTWAEAVAAGSTTVPIISAAPSTLNGFVYGINTGPSASQSYNLSGADLTPASGNITVTPSANYEISLNNTTFGLAPVNIAYTAGVLASTPVYVRLKAGLASGTYNGEIITNAGGEATTANVTCSGTVEAPASTTLPYIEDFTTGLGLCYTKSVSGPAQYWKHSASGGYAYMNGFNTGVLEEDWLVLPAVNFNNYFNISMTFESFMNYGADDADNYFKLVYSTDYAGIGDPTSATWTELAFDYPTVLSTWTPSGTIDLSTITGSSVYIAFKYHYNVSFYRSWQVDNISIIEGDTPALAVSPATLTGFTYIIGNGPSAAQTYTLSGMNLTGSGNIVATAPADYEVSLNGTTFTATLNVPYAGGVITGQPVTIYTRLKAGLAAGNYNNELIVHTGGSAVNTSVTCSGNVTLPLPVITSETLPQWIQGMNGTNAQRVPFAYRASIGNLVANATYRYYNQVVISTDSPTTNGAGNPILVNADGTFTRTSSPGMGTAGNYGEFTADASGNYTGWFMTEPTANARFTPENEVFMRIMLNDGNAGTTVSNRVTTSATVGVINFGLVNQAGEGTGIRGISTAAAGNMVYLYDNTEGTGRPVYGTSVETTGVDYTAIGTYASFYSTLVQGVNGSWGGIIPNVLPDGIRRIEERSNSDGSLVAVHTSVDGVWGAYDTRNPTGGDYAIIVIDLMASGDPLLMVSPTVLTGFSYPEGSGPSAVQTYLLSGSDLVGSGVITVSAPPDYEISSDGTTFTNFELELPFADGVITGQPVTISVRLKAGLVVGDYNGEGVANVGGDATNVTVTCSGSVVAVVLPEITNVTLPLYIQGINGTNNNRVPLAYRATFNNLTANATYRFFNKVVLQSDAPDYGGAGNCIFVAADGSFTRTSSTSLGTPGEYGEFTTDAIGSFSGWFITEPSGNARFTPGNELYMRISLNDGAEGTAVANLLTTTDFTTVLQFGTGALPTEGTAIRGISNDNPKDFVYLFDNIAGTGRPLCATQIEASGVDFVTPGSYAPFYTTSVAGVSGSWGGIVPNVNAAGLQRVEVRSLDNGSLLGDYNVESGIWILTDTHNPNGGLENVLVIDLISIGIDNPENGALSIYSTGKEIRVLTTDVFTHTLTLFNLQGQAVYTQQLSGSSSYTLSLNVPVGIYVARLSNATVNSAVKLMIR